MSETPANWYPDSERPGQLRYWDGTRWTDNWAPDRSSPAAQPNPYAQRPPSGTNVGLIVAIIAGSLVLLGILVPTIIWAVAMNTATSAIGDYADEYLDDSSSSDDSSDFGEVPAEPDQVEPAAPPVEEPAAPVEPYFTVSDLEAVGSPNLPAGFEQTGSAALGESSFMESGADDDFADPFACSALVPSSPRQLGEGDEGMIVEFANAKNDARDMYVVGFGRAFDSSADAQRQLDLTGQAVASCSGGYVSNNYSAADIRALDIATDPSIVATGWTEEHDSGRVFATAELRYGNLVVRSYCSGSASEVADRCDFSWVTQQILALPRSD